jgi:hypothetical protein
MATGAPRIGELIAARPPHDAAGFVTMQNDTVSLLAREILQTLRPCSLARTPRTPMPYCGTGTGTWRPTLHSR